MFCAIATTTERCKMEGVVNVFQVVKALRVQKPGVVLNVVSMQHRWSHVHWHSGNIDLRCNIPMHIQCYTCCMVAIAIGLLASLSGVSNIYNLGMKLSSYKVYTN